MTAEHRWSCSARRAGDSGSARTRPRQRIAELLPAVSRDDQVALWLAAQVVVRVLGEMRESAGLKARAEPNITG